MASVELPSRRSLRLEKKGPDEPGIFVCGMSHVQTPLEAFVLSMSGDFEGGSLASMLCKLCAKQTALGNTMLSLCTGHGVTQAEVLFLSHMKSN